MLGATSLVADRLLPRLLAHGFEVGALSRRPPATKAAVPGLAWLAGDLAEAWSPESDWPLAFHLAPLWLLPPLVERLARRGLRRLVAFGSTSRFTRAGSGDPAERELGLRLAAAESDLERVATDNGVTWTLFRPTLIYGGGRDRNVSAMAGFARRFGFVPVAGQATGQRQPVRADDLAAACLAVLERPATFGRAYDLPGGETLTVHEMASRITRHVLGKPRVLRVSTPVLRGMILVASRVSSFSQLTPEMANRMNEDLVFDGADAHRDFGWDPGPFELESEGPQC